MLARRQIGGRKSGPTSIFSPKTRPPGGGGGWSLSADHRPTVSHNHSSLRENMGLQVVAGVVVVAWCGSGGGGGFETNVTTKQGSPQQREGCSWCTVTNLHPPHRRLEPLSFFFSHPFFWRIILFPPPPRQNQTCCLSRVCCFLCVTWRGERVANR